MGNTNTTKRTAGNCHVLRNIKKLYNSAYYREALTLRQVNSAEATARAIVEQTVRPEFVEKYVAQLMAK